VVVMTVMMVWLVWLSRVGVIVAEQLFCNGGAQAAVTECEEAV